MVNGRVGMIRELKGDLLEVKGMPEVVNDYFRSVFSKEEDVANGTQWPLQLLQEQAQRWQVGQELNEMGHQGQSGRPQRLVWGGWCLGVVLFAGRGPSVGHRLPTEEAPKARREVASFHWAISPCGETTPAAGSSGVGGKTALSGYHPLVAPLLNSTDLQQFNIEENGGTPFTGAAAGRRHLPNRGLITLELEDTDTYPGMPSPSKLSSAVLPHYEEIGMCFKQLEVESSKMAGQWPSLHINMNNKGEEKKLLEKGLHSPASPSSLPDQMKSNIIKAQMDAALKVGAQFKKEEPVLSSHSKSSGTPVDGVRSLDPSQDGTPVSGVQEKQRPKSSRLRKLTRQYSLNLVGVFYSRIKEYVIDLIDNWEKFKYML
ncbi:band 4.1-like protein 4B [Heterodontus francisci]|uniref:band 4.1-like protein 4B n=1 Tax=Heterodontus francisci TaxID=7792 RepID=UPI00355BA199